MNDLKILLEYIKQISKLIPVRVLLRKLINETAFLIFDQQSGSFYKNVSKMNRKKGFSVFKYFQYFKVYRYQII